MTSKQPSALTIAGSDSGGGAGIQADLKTFAAHGVHGLSAIAALTAQNLHGVRAVHVPDAGFLRAQIDAVFEDFPVGAVKLGMLATAAVIEATAEALVAHAPPLVVLDPVMVATSGARLLEPSALAALRAALLPRADLVTPNVPEAALLVGHPIESAADAERAVDELLELGARAVLLKGGHLDEGGRVIDRYGNAAARFTVTHERLAVDGHGTGCTLASAIAAGVCRGSALGEACRAATDYVHGALVHAARPGRSEVAVLAHFWRLQTSADYSGVQSR